MIQTKRRINGIKETKVMIVVKDGLTRLWINDKHVEKILSISFAAVGGDAPYLEYEVLE